MFVCASIAGRALSLAAKPHSWTSRPLLDIYSPHVCQLAACAASLRQTTSFSMGHGPSKTPRAQHPLALVGKLLQQLKKDTLQNICEDLKEPVSGNKEELILRIADAM